ncbi:hypothetical protein SADUNF_Sadunf04G0032700 [Salix dunnii]|uniref:Uncharacterized protein n=1 Tax=Salix dunnii TaxID=1413687 RepID=A0A835K6P1_9ROSI|nr:hypothetical protein SADUNF_Sadunf04G0032700 [Salix dunnii]
MDSDLSKEILFGEIKLTAVSNENYRYCSQQDVLSEKEKIILDNLFFAHERRLRKVFANALAACQQHYKDLLSEKQDVLRRVKLALEDLVPDIEDLYILCKGNTEEDTADQSGHAMEITHAKTRWRMPNLKTYLPAYTMLQQEAIKRNLKYLEEASEEVYRLIIQKLHSESKGFKSLKQHLEMATINTHAATTMLSSDSGLISLVVARLGSPETLVSGFFENGLLHKLEVDTTSYREATLLPGCVQQSLEAYVTEVRRFKKIVPQKIFLRFYSTGPDWEHDGVSYFPSYHLILMDYDEELHAKPIRSIKREWQEAWMEEKEVQKRKALSMKIIVETLRYIFRDSCPCLKIYAVSSRILMLGNRIYGNNRYGWYQARQREFFDRIHNWCNGEFEASAFCKGHYCSLMQGCFHRCTICQSPEIDMMSEDYALDEEALRNL